MPSFSLNVHVNMSSETSHAVASPPGRNSYVSGCLETRTSPYIPAMFPATTDQVACGSKLLGSGMPSLSIPPLRGLSSWTAGAAGAAAVGAAAGAAGAGAAGAAGSSSVLLHATITSRTTTETNSTANFANPYRLTTSPPSQKRP